jgi:hypothetical protein
MNYVKNVKVKSVKVNLDKIRRSKNELAMEVEALNAREIRKQMSGGATGQQNARHLTSGRRKRLDLLQRGQITLLDPDAATGRRPKPARSLSHV